MKPLPLVLAICILLSACSAAQAEPEAAAEEEELNIVTLLPKDAIRSIDDPAFYAVQEADQEYDDAELVLGVVMEGEARAYSTGLLSNHEIVNDVVGGHPIAVTW